MSNGRNAASMPDEGDDSHLTSRRSVLAAAAGATAASVTVGLGAARPDLPREYLLEQDGECYPVSPLSGDVPVEELYGWDTSDYSATGLVDLEREDASIMFLYDGPKGLSLVLVHDRYDATAPTTSDRGGGSATFTFSGLPENGRWVVQDDLYDGPTNYDRWSRDGSEARVDWTWAGNRTDGGAFRGLEEAVELTIEPAFNETAALYGQHYDGRIADWQVLSGSLTDPERYSLRLDSAVTLAPGTCPGGDVDPPVTDQQDGDGREADDRGDAEGGPRWADGDEGGPPFDDDGKPGRGPTDGPARKSPPGLRLGVGRSSLDPFVVVARLLGS